MSGQGLYGHGDNIVDSEGDAWDIFSNPKAQDICYNWNEFTVKSKHPIQNSEFNPIHFDIGSADSRWYTMLDTLWCDGEIKVTMSDGANLAAGASVAPVNIFPHTLFQSIGIKINDQPISDHARLYPFRLVEH